MKRLRSADLPPPTASEAAFEALLATFDVPAAPATAALTPAAADAQRFVQALFAKSQEYLTREPYANIGDSSGFNTKIVGVTFEGRQDTASTLVPGEPLTLERQPANPFDPNAIAVFIGAIHLGFIKKEIAARIAPLIDAGERYRAEVRHVTGGGERSTGVNIWVSREATVAPPSNVTAGDVSAQDVLHALIGERPIRDAQRAVLERVASGKNVLAVLGTGRGKSLCFQYPAAMAALERSAKTLVLYPLRALANDQFDALTRRLGPLGIRILRANGAIDAGERALLFDALETGDWDIILSTPEFAYYHADRFTNGRSHPALVVIDEAHHLIESTHRPAYGAIGSVIERLGSPQVLALTATAGDAVFAGIRRALRIESWVIDPTVRENLHVVEARGSTNKVAYILRAIEPDGKAIIYCNSRSEATKVAEKLRGRFGDAVAFYHAGVGSEDRARVEAFFRSGEIRIVVATSAFGEGIDLPDVRDVFLYHLNFDLTEFNQQSGRAGRDGAKARIHLLFGERDRNLNDYIIEREAPTVHTLRAIYRGIKAIAVDNTVHMTYRDISDTLALDKVADRTVSIAARIFADAGLLEIGEDDDGRYLRLREVTEKVDLERNERFAEGEAEREAFNRFAELVLNTKPDVLQAVINRPIYPSGVPLLQ